MSKKDQAKGEGPQYADLVAGLRKQFLSGKTKSLAWRREQLTQVQMMFEENHDEITEAVRADLGGPKLRGLAELGPHKGAQMALDNLSRWTADEPVSTPFTVCPTLLASSFVRTEPKGVVLVISPWNYPIDLALGGVVSAIAAGNTIVLKPSEISQNSARVIEKLCNKYLDTSCIRVVMGAVPETTALLKERFDHIFYTGNGTVGRIIMRAASEHLTPVTLELGGKSPVIIDKTAKMTSVVERISTAKWINVGQTCIAPDYLLVHESIAQEVIDRLVEYTKAYKPTAKESKDYGRVISERHAQRLRDLLVNTKGKVLTGGAGDVDIANRFVPPTIITDVALDDPVLSDEIFGPILPIITIKDTTEALATIQKVCPTPLALYVFSEDTKQTKM
ncbi:Aldehyde dehydrogenase, partial [Diplonema papillatum]